MNISVVVPLYNKAPYVLRALDSIAAQIYRDFEVIIVDDGSTDGGGQIAADYSDSRFRVLTQPNSGPGAARNRGIAEASAQLVAFLDADDEWLPSYLSAAHEALQHYGQQVASFTSGYIDYPGGLSTERLWRKRGLEDGVYRVNKDSSPALLAHSLAYMSPCTTVSRTEVLRKWGGFYSRSRCVFGEDAFLWLKILLNETVAFQLRPEVRLHREAANLSKNLEGPRPLEPFLEDPALITAVCPPELRDLLQELYTFRAFKTACFWGYWGAWRQARALRNRFRSPLDYRLPYYTSSLVCSTPMGAAIGTLLRMLARPQN